MILPSNKYAPEFIPRVEKGEFPNNLLFGFEAEMSLWNIDSTYIDDVVFGLIKDTNNFYYIKYDGSVSCRDLGSGSEINSQPFNWNFLLNHLDYIKKLCNLKKINDDGQGSKAKQFKVNKSCGFHIHLNREFFSNKHQIKMAKLFYENPDFIEDVSLRDNSASFQQYSAIRIKESAKDFVEHSIEHNIHNSYRYKALNLTGKDTIEIRIFQGTLNYKTILSYLEFALAVTMFTKNNISKNIEICRFLKYIKENEAIYPNLADLKNGKLSWE